jgi:hypothetical protein
MKCPACLATMENRDERHHVEPDSYRMNLHCCNYDYQHHRSNCFGRAHMGVIVPPSYANQEWICDHYNLHFKDKGRYRILRAVPSTPIIKLINGKWELIYNPKHKYTQILTDYQSPPILSVPFIPISTNNDMHEQAQRIFNRLTTLIVFS